MKKKLWLFTLLLVSMSAFAQRAGIQGTVVNSVTGNPEAGVLVQVEGAKKQAVTNSEGQFRIENLSTGSLKISFMAPTLEPVARIETIKSEGLLSMGKIAMTPLTSLNGNIQKSTRQVKATQMDKAKNLANENKILFDESMLDDDSGNEQAVSYLAGSSDDVFLNAASFSFSPMRFNVRGYGQESQTTYLNGLNFNDAERGKFNYSMFGGLNDATRNKDIINGVDASTYAYGPVGGTTNINMRPTSFAAGTKASVAYTNRSYKLRGQVIHSTGILPNGWAFTGSAVYRWADEGIQQGTFYNSAGFFLGAEKTIGKHVFAATAFVAPTQRGQAAGTVQEVYDLMGIYYNPYWGYQGGEKRNSRIVTSMDPTLMLNHEFKITPTSSLKSGLAAHYNLYGGTALNFYNAPDPRPDYYRNLPGYFESPEMRDEMTRLWKDGSASQVQWDELYAANKRNDELYPNSNAKYFIGERHNDLFETIFNTLYTNQLNKKLKLTGGIEAKYSQAMHYTTMTDLMGAKKWTDIDQFAERDFVDDKNIIQNDLNNPNRDIKVGDRMAYDYNMNIYNASAFVQNNWDLRKWNIYYAAKISTTSFYRDGNMRNGRAESVKVLSYGKGTQYTFVNPSLKAGTIFKISPRMWATANVMAETRAPLVYNSYLSPRVKDTRVPNLKSEKVLSYDLSYNIIFPRIKARITAYRTHVQDAAEMNGYYNDILRTFVNHAVVDLNKLYQGVELGISVKISDSFTLSAAGTYGDHRYTNDGKGLVSPENGATKEFQGDMGKPIPGTGNFADMVHTKGLYINSGPQMAFNIQLDYFHPQMWFADINLSYFDKNYLDFAPIRFTETNRKNILNEAKPYYDAAIQARKDYSNPGNTNADRLAYRAKYDEKMGIYQDYKDLTTQEKLKGGFLLDISVGKLIYFNGRAQQLNINLSANNVLNNKKMVTGGYQQGRFDLEYPNKYPSKYYYAWGTNVFLNIGFKF